MLTVEADDRTAIVRLTQIRPKVTSAISREATALALQLQARVKGALSGEILQVQTGFLRSHVFQDVKSTGDAVIGEVFTSGVKYAAVHEYGGTSPYEIKPKSGKALRWFAGGFPVFAKSVIHPPAKMRSFMRYSLDEMKGEIIERMRAALIAATK